MQSWKPYVSDRSMGAWGGLLVTVLALAVAGCVAPNAPQILFEKPPDGGGGGSMRVSGVTGRGIEAAKGKKGSVGVV